MQFTEYKEIIARRLTRYFNLIPDGMFGGKQYELAASYSARENQTVLFKENVMDYAESQELCLLQRCHGHEIREEEFATLSNAALLMAGTPGRNHKSTVAVGVFVSEEPVDEKTARSVRRFRWSRWFRFGFYGWCVVKVVLVDLTRNRVYSNHAGADVKKMFFPEVKGESKKK